MFLRNTVYDVFLNFEIVKINFIFIVIAANDVIGQLLLTPNLDPVPL